MKCFKCNEEIHENPFIVVESKGTSFRLDKLVHLGCSPTGIFKTDEGRTLRQGEIVETVINRILGDSKSRTVTRSVIDYRDTPKLVYLESIDLIEDTLINNSYIDYLIELGREILTYNEMYFTNRCNSNINTIQVTPR